FPKKAEADFSHSKEVAKSGNRSLNEFARNAGKNLFVIPEKKSIYYPASFKIKPISSASLFQKFICKKFNLEENANEKINLLHNEAQYFNEDH
ncbi:hypothetical protein HK096_006752, partial [Nowakowskiella sp. JEL0078]